MKLVSKVIPFFVSFLLGYCTPVCRIYPWYVFSTSFFIQVCFYILQEIDYFTFMQINRNLELCWYIGCNNQHNRDRLLCAMAGIIPSLLNRYSLPIFHHSHILEPVCHRWTRLLDYTSTDRDPNGHDNTMPVLYYIFIGRSNIDILLCRNC